MIFHYTLSKTKFRRLLFQKQQRTNYFYLGLFSILYFCFCYRMLQEDVLSTIGIFIIGFILLWLVLIALNSLFTTLLLKMNEKHTSNLYGQHVLRIEDDQLVETIDDEILILKKDDIKKITYLKNSIRIVPVHGHVVIRFDRVLFDDVAEFDQLCEELKKFES